MRWIELDGCGHFRDVGGYAVADGWRTKWRTLYRSGSLDALSSSGAIGLRDLGVRTVIDLRMDDERAVPAPWNHDDAIEVVSLPSANPGSASLRAGAFDAGALYVAAIDDRARELPMVMSVLADASRLPAVIGCSGGKDRTGMTVALVLGLLGVVQADIIDDYALSDTFMTRDPDAYAAALDRITSAGLDPEVLRTRPETMRRFLHAIADRFGSVDQFAAMSRVATNVIDGARANLLEPATPRRGARPHRPTPGRTLGRSVRR